MVRRAFVPADGWTFLVADYMTKVELQVVPICRRTRA